MADGLNFVSNLVIVAGYILVPFLWLPYLPLTKPVLISGTMFFLTCAFTHVSMAFGFEHHPLMVLNHVVQAVAVMAFVIGFARLLRKAYIARKEGRVVVFETDKEPQP